MRQLPRQIPLRSVERRRAKKQAQAAFKAAMQALEVRSEIDRKSREATDAFRKIIGY